MGQGHVLERGLGSEESGWDHGCDEADRHQKRARVTRSAGVPQSGYRCHERCSPVCGLQDCYPAGRGAPACQCPKRPQAHRCSAAAETSLPSMPESPDDEAHRLAIISIALSSL